MTACPQVLMLGRKVVISWIKHYPRMFRLLKLRMRQSEKKYGKRLNKNPTKQEPLCNSLQEGTILKKQQLTITLGLCLPWWPHSTPISAQTRHHTTPGAQGHQEQLALGNVLSTWGQHPGPPTTGSSGPRGGLPHTEVEGLHLPQRVSKWGTCIATKG